MATVKKQNRGNRRVRRNDDTQDARRDDDRTTKQKTERREKVAVSERTYVDTEAQRDKFGGFHFGAAFFGWLVAIGVGAILTSLLTAAGSAVALTGLNDINASEVGEAAATIGLVSAILILLVLAIAYYAGGYVAGRMSRFDGGRQGLGVWLMGLVVAIVLALLAAILGSKYNVLQQLNLPSIPTDKSTFTDGGLITTLLALVITALAAIGGGKAGEGFHRKIDRAGGIRD